MNRVLVGAIAGFCGTAAMTVAARALYRALPHWERYALPPREITEAVAKETGLASYLGEEGMRNASLAAHFGYGAAVGALYEMLRPERPSPALTGAAYGLAVWTVSYLGWIPAFGILRRGDKHPPRRNGLMLAAHVVWGGTTGFLAAQIQKSGDTILDGERRATDRDRP